MVHIYCGSGKGKTTAATGLAVRAAGSGMKVLFTQFYKSGKSCEIAAMKQIGGIDFRFADQVFGRFKTMTEQQKELTRQRMCALLDEIERIAGEYDLIVLDEIISAYNNESADRACLLRFIQTHRGHAEIVLTGRDPKEELIALADYVSEIRMVKHPFERGIDARRGIEY